MTPLIIYKRSIYVVILLLIIWIMFVQLYFHHIEESNKVLYKSEIGHDCYWSEIGDQEVVCNRSWEKYRDEWDPSMALINISRDGSQKLIMNSEYQLAMQMKGYHPIVRGNKELKSRLDTLYHYCNKFNTKQENILVLDWHDTILFNDDFELLQCSTPKVSSRTWLYLFMELTGEYVKHEREIDLSNAIWNSILLKYNLQSDTKTSLRFQTYTKMIMARHPFAKLLSAYNDRFCGAKQYYEEQFADDIINFNYLRGLPKNIEEFNEANNKGGLNLTKERAKFIITQIQRLKAGFMKFNITFKEFLVYIINYSQERHKSTLDKHWGLYSCYCNPCAVRYDIITKFETRDEDSKALLQYIIKNSNRNASTTLDKSGKKFASTERCNQEFKKIPMWIKKQLYAVYKEDFLMFSYPYDEKLLEDNPCYPGETNT